jgi:hypothetical protein
MPATRIPCPFDGCIRYFTNQRGINAHVGRKHKAIFNPYQPNTNNDLQPHHHLNHEEYINQELFEEIHHDYNENPIPTPPPEILDDIPEAERYRPFTHEQYWILNWMHNALVSQSQQNRFYKVIQNTSTLGIYS